jgi:hypothetical protein
MMNESYSNKPDISTIKAVDLPQVDAVLVTGSSLQSLSSLQYYYGQDFYKGRTKNNDKSLANTNQIYATFPIVKIKKGLNEFIRYSCKC